MTKQEQTKQMLKTLCDKFQCSAIDRSYMAKSCRQCEDIIEALHEAGYGNVSEYKSEREMLGSQIKALKQRLNNKYVEIENLKAEYKQLETNAEILAWGVRDLNHENYELTEKIKQAQIDTINTIVKYCENPNHWNELKDCKLFGGKSNDLRDFLNGIFKEGNDENARTL